MVGPRSDRSTLLVVDGLHYHVPGRASAVVDNVSFALQPEQICILLGAEGSGRSSLLAACAGLAPALLGGRVDGERSMPEPSGRMHCDRVPLERWTREMSLILDDPASMLSGARDTVREEVAFGLACRGTERVAMARTVDATLAALAIEHLSARDPSTLSGGEMARVVLAATLVVDPHVLLVDEAEASLDAAGRELFVAALARRAASGNAVLWAPSSVEHASWPDAGLRGERAPRPAELATPAQRAKPNHPTAIPAWADGGLLLAGGSCVGRASGDAWWQGLHLPRAGVNAPLLARWQQRAAADRSASSSLGPVHVYNAEDSGSGMGRARLRTDHLSQSLVALAPERSGGLYVRDLRAERDGVGAVVHDVSFDVAPGEVLAVIGANGSGKSSLLQALLGLGPRSAGRIRVGGRTLDGRETALRAREIGLVWQRSEDQLFARSVSLEVGFGPRALGGRGERLAETVACALRASGLERMADTHPLDLGRGARRRVTIAAALAMRTPVLALDEPERGLDEEGRTWLVALLRGLADSGRTVVVASHDMDVLGRVADRVLVMAHGVGIADGPARRILRDRELLATHGLAAAPAVVLGQALASDPVPLHGDALLEAALG